MNENFKSENFEEITDEMSGSPEGERAEAESAPYEGSAFSSPDENKEIPEEQFVEPSPDGAFSEDGFFFSESDIDEKIEIPKVTPEDKRSGRRGLAVFAVLVSVAVLLSGAFAGGYFLGRNTGSGTLADKPEGAAGSNAAGVYEAAAKSIAGVYLYNTAGAQYSVSGIVYTADGYIITTDSVYSIINSPGFIVEVDGNHYTASFVGGDQNSDVSVIKINEPVNLTPAELGDSSKAETGEAVYAIGRSGGYDMPAVIYEGIITASDTRVSNSITSRSNEVIQSSTTANMGDFGGALVNAHGQVIGMLSTKVVSDGYDSITYSTPSATVKRVADQIIENGSVTDRPRLGISYIFRDFAAVKISGLAAVGLEVQTVDSESELYGVLKEKDIITHVNGIPTKSDDVLLDVIDASKPGDSLTLTVIGSDGKSADYTVKLLRSESTSSYSAPALNEDPNLPDGSLEGF